MHMLNNEPNVPPIFIGVLHEQLNSIVEAEECDPAFGGTGCTKA